jgi:hypothetical protein
MIGEEIIVYEDFNITDKTNFQIFMLDSLNTLANNISEGFYNDETIKNYTELQRILTGFYNNCVNNNYELAIIFNHTGNEYNLLIDYLEYYNYNLTFYNSFVILDNNTNYSELKNLIGFLLQTGDIARDNLINNFLHVSNNENAYIYKKTEFSDGMIKTTNMEHNEYFDVVFEVVLMNVCYYLIGDITYLFRIKGYNLDTYENTWEEIKSKNKEFEKMIDNYYKIDQ